MTPEDRIKQLGASNQGHADEADWAAFRQRAHRSVARRRAAGALGGAVLVAVVLVGAWFVTSGDSPLDQKRPDVGIATEPPSPSPGEADEREQETVYLQQWYVENDKLMLYWAPFETPATDDSQTREIEEATQAMQMARVVETLTTVPGPLEETGVVTAVPADNEVEVAFDDGTANVVVTGEFPDQYKTQQRFAYAQVVYTLTQFRTVEDVSIAWRSDNPPTVVASAGDEDRTDYEDLLPPIVVERPRAGETVRRTFTLSGIANVYEATVSYRLVDEDEEVVHEGFTTATCGSGCWGTFADTITYDGNRDWVELQVFESSAEDGSPLHLMKLPINFR